ncbi:MAG TPA: PVC-type heme-binding CxxCH protein [Gemmataceae bacterium]|nr:PVC-type heme-binding CxxCH protein [Gemmataceae bacterium]
MKHWPFLGSLGLLVCCLIAGHTQVPPEKAVSTFKVAEGLELSLWASEPLFVNPTCIDIDHRGRVWVCESVNYRHKLHNQPPRRPEGDRIVILEDSHGTGRADKATTFYQSKETLAPLGIAVAKDPVGPGYKVFVCQSPDILLFEDKDGDGKADGPPRKLLSGFRGIDHDHGVHGISIGPDGRLYFSIGDQGVAGLVDKHGKTWTTNQTDCRAGTIWRCDLDGKNLELIAHNFRNEYEPCVDSFGTVFVSDNDDDGNQQTRICYVMPGGNYGYWPRGPGQSHWHEEHPGVVPKILRTYFGSPTGICVYEGALLPKKYQGQLLHTDAGPRQLRCYHLTPEGASYAVEREDIVTSTDNWFRPSDVCVAPDGSVLIADWYDPGVGGHGMGDTTRGRIFRLAPKGAVLKTPGVELGTSAGILAALASPALSVRSMAMAKLESMAKESSAESSKEVASVIEAALNQKENPWLRARALWQAARLHVGLDHVYAAVRDPDPRFRVQSLRLLQEYLRERWNGALELAINDPSPAVRREALLLLRNEPADKAKPAIYRLARGYDGQDRFYLEAIGIAVGQDKVRRESILSNFEEEFPQWDEKTAKLIWEFRPPKVLPRLVERVTDKNLPISQRSQIVGIIASAEGPEAGVSLLKILQQDVSQDVREPIIENLKLFLPSKWRSLRQSPELGRVIEQLLSQPQTRTLALALIVAAEKTSACNAVTQIAMDDRQLTTVRLAALNALGSLPATEAVQGLGELIKNSGQPFALRNEAVQSLGLLAQRKPTQPATRAALVSLQLMASANDQDLAVRQAALTALAGSRNGSIWLLQSGSKGILAGTLKADAGRLLRNSPYQDLRKQALVAFPAPGKLDPKKLPALPRLVQRTGNSLRGKELMTASLKNDLQCMKCHRIRGAGGSVGPDLSVVGKKASRENLFESILFPSKAIADQYVTWVVETKKGIPLTGLIVEETGDHIILRDGNAKDTRVEKSEIETRAKSPNSLMPNDLLAYMTEDDLVDIVEYLFGLKSSALTLENWHIAGPFDNGDNDEGIDRVFPPEKQIDLKARYTGKSGPVGWRTVGAGPQGYVDLQEFLAGDSNNVVSYLYREIESPGDQETAISLGTDDCAKLWINGKLVYTNRSHRAAAPEQDMVKSRLKKGRNQILLKINNGDGPHGFYMTFVAEQDLKGLTEK